ncbi:MAG TPA: hypothetical protein IAA64_01550 [Candidatus Ornithocaccomicrobium faecavium]|uniref:Uncharacterized protein n=1 Tax=Candidatus Ornithocaccomicrobium faecavium TaxID=2840890 RepID=A0A9D1P4T3_9FIRM|nr:hypothetical protein [Clostridiales bacterium]HIV26628.1 hypothetical protein [Candidatus Ornithocaccomicrobium faecavium]
MANPFSRGGVSRKDAKAMGDMLAGGKSSARGSIYSRMMREPQPEARLLSSRGIVALVLLIALPPVGIAFVWRMRMFMPRGRALLTALSTLILAVMVAIMMPTSDMQTVTPSPAMPKSFSSVENTQAEADLSRITQLSDAPGVSATTPPQVYTADGDPYYHASSQCGDTELTLMITLEETAARSLSPCPVCQPPTLSN